jgi:hypothetical protein
MLEPVRIDAIPNLALKKPARHQLLLQSASGTDLQPTDAQTPPS